MGGRKSWGKFKKRSGPKQKKTRECKMYFKACFPTLSEKMGSQPFMHTFFGCFVTDA